MPMLESSKDAVVRKQNGSGTNLKPPWNDRSLHGIEVNGDTGGYNLQASFSTGWLAGHSAALSCLPQ